jgi:hypothetical protein
MRTVIGRSSLHVLSEELITFVESVSYWGTKSKRGQIIMSVMVLHESVPKAAAVFSASSQLSHRLH